MKAIWSLILGLLSASCLAQNTPQGSPLPDASLLASYANGASTTTAQEKCIYTLINTYGYQVSDHASLMKAVAGNVFLQDLFKDIPDAARLLAAPPGGIAPQVAIPQALDLSATNIAGAIGTFIATRIREEAETYFIQKMKDNVKVDSLLSNLFPATLQVLTNNSDASQLGSFLQTLGEALTKDMSKMPVDLEKFLEKKPAILGDFTGKDYYFPIVFLYKVSLQIKSLPSLVAQINSWIGPNADPLIGQMPAKFQGYFQLLSVLSNTFTIPASAADPSKVNYYSGAEILKALTGKSLSCFLGLFLLKYQPQLKAVPLTTKAGGATNLYNVINDNLSTTQLTDLSNWTATVSQRLANVLTAFNAVTNDLKPAVGKLNPTDLANCIAAISTALNSLLKFPFSDFGLNIDSDLVANMGTVTGDVAAAGAIVVEMENQSYGLVLTQTISLLQTFGVPADNKILAQLTKYGNFAASVIAAKNQSDVVNALENAAMPVGSYSIKRKALVDISLNAYGGVFGAYQSYFSKSQSLPAGVKNENLLAGVAAPVGFAISWGGLRQRCVNGQQRQVLTGTSHSIFISLIDVGAVTAFRLESDATSTLPTFTWANILAPGLYYVRGIANCPLSWGLGAQYGPQLRSISTTTVTTTPSPWSFRLFVAIDIPFFDFYTRSPQ